MENYLKYDKVTPSMDVNTLTYIFSHIPLKNKDHYNLTHKLTHQHTGMYQRRFSGQILFFCFSSALVAVISKSISTLQYLTILDNTIQQVAIFQ